MFFLNNIGPVDPVFLMKLIIPHVPIIPLMHKTGYIEVDEEHYLINKCLFDSGSLSANFISQSFVDKHTAIFSHLTQPYDSKVHLGDSVTTVIITHLITPQT